MGEAARVEHPGACFQAWLDSTYLRIMQPSSALRLACSQARAPRAVSMVPPVEWFGGGGLAVSHVLTTTLELASRA